MRVKFPARPSTPNNSTWKIRLVCVIMSLTAMTKTILCVLGPVGAAQGWWPVRKGASGPVGGVQGGWRYAAGTPHSVVFLCRRYSAGLPPRGARPKPRTKTGTKKISAVAAAEAVPPLTLNIVLTSMSKAAL